MILRCCIIFFLFCFSISLNLLAQSEILVRVDTEKMDRIRAEQNMSNIIGKVYSIQEVTTSNKGMWLIKGNYHIWHLPIRLDTDCGIVIYFEELILPKGGEVRAFTPDGKLSTPTYYENANQFVPSFALPHLNANDVILEIKIPLGKKAQLKVAINKVGAIVAEDLHTMASSRGFGDAPDCFANVNCEEGMPWQDQKRAVVRYMTISGGEIGWCSGVLLNNTAQNCKNYFLSDQHCSISSTEIEFGQHVFYFNYESEGCENPSTEDGLTDQTVVGCTKVASSGYSTEFPPDGSDFQLLELNSIPESYNVYYSGWNRNDISELAGNGAIIQHPQSDIKKISFWDEVTPSGTSIDHLYVYNIASANGDGISEPQASGSPIFDVNKLVIGNVTAGDAGCISETPNPFVVGGRFYSHWEENGTNMDLQLKPWLDPVNSGVMTLPGKNQCNVTSTNEIISGSTIYVKINPNPANNEFVVFVKDRIIKKIELHDLLGKKLKEVQNHNRVNIGDLVSGIYVVNITFSDGVFTSAKIVKE